MYSKKEILRGAEKKNKIIKIGIISVIILVIAYTFFKNEKGEEIENIITFEEQVEVPVVQEKSKIKVYVAGEIKKPGVIELEEGERIEDAIMKAGGVTENANLEMVNLAYKLEDGQKLYIPNINDANEEYLSTENGEKIIEETKVNSTNSVINVNKADIEMLCNLPGVGEALAQRIIEYREQNGFFKSAEDLKNVSGIGDKKFESLKEYVVVK